MIDDLEKPLGLNVRRPGIGAKLSRHAPRALLAAFGLCLFVFAGWIVLVDDPYGGEPMARIDAGLAPTLATAPTPAVAQRPVTPSPEVAPAVIVAAPPAGPAGPTVTIIDGSTGARQEVPIGGGGRKAPEFKSSEPKLSEPSRHGPIPKIAPDGSRPSDAFAQKISLERNTPRIAIVMTGLGVGASITETALVKLPATVTFAVSPYAVDAPALAARARAAGRELLLQVPMEPFDYPDNDPGPQTLLTALSPDQNVDRMHWMMSRFTGYVGIATSAGGRFTASEPSLTPVLREAAKRGLLVFDDGVASKSVAAQIAGANSLAFGRADITLDAGGSAAALDRALGRAEAMARERGSAMATIAPTPVAIERIAQWAKSLEGRGIVLVPISAVATRKPLAAGAT